MEEIGGGEDTVLAVDLDGTLIRSDLLFESWWSVVSRDVGGALGALILLTRGGGGAARAAFKQALARRAAIDIARLPYNDDVLELIQARKSVDGRVVLVTAADQALAEQVAEHLCIFDEVHGSDGVRNLKGPIKEAFLEERFGAGGFDYAGDSPADLDVWRKARGAITVNASDGLRQAAERVADGSVEHLGESSSEARAWIKALRPHQWAKNILVFLPLLAAHTVDPRDWLMGLLAFVAFSMIASGVYLLNDMIDLSADRAHARKRFRPLASGAMHLKHGTLLAPVMIGGGILAAFLLGPPLFGLVLIGYLVLTTAYSLVLKRRLVVDICTLAGLYTIRIIAGAAASGIWLSPWMLAFSVFLFLSLAAVKRQAELVSTIAEGKEKSSGRAYVPGDLPVIVGMALASGYVAVLVAALYVSSPGVSTLYKSPLWLWGICPILLYWISRVIMLTHRGQMDDDPVLFAIKDPSSRICGVLILMIALVGSLL